MTPFSRTEARKRGWSRSGCNPGTGSPGNEDATPRVGHHLFRCGATLHRADHQFRIKTGGWTYDTNKTLSFRAHNLFPLRKNTAETSATLSGSVGVGAEMRNRLFFALQQSHGRPSRQRHATILSGMVRVVPARGRRRSKLNPSPWSLSAPIRTAERANEKR